MQYKPPHMIKRAKEMRYHLTPAEMRLWWYLQRGKKVIGRFRRQEPFGRYILDFVSFEHRLVIEVDGSQHTPESDAVRDAFLKSEGFYVLRFNNHQVMKEIQAVMEAIYIAVKNRPVKPTPTTAARLPTLPQGED